MASAIQQANDLTAPLAPQPALPRGPWMLTTCLQVVQAEVISHGWASGALPVGHLLQSTVSWKGVAFTPGAVAPCGLL